MAQKKRGDKIGQYSPQGGGDNMRKSSSQGGGNWVGIYFPQGAVD
jgi:hypothetical protein